MSHLRLLFHLISQLYERTSIRPVGEGFKRAANPALDPWRAGSFSRPPGSTRLSTFCVFLNKSRGREFVGFWLAVDHSDNNPANVEDHLFRKSLLYPAELRDQTTDF